MMVNGKMESKKAMEYGKGLRAIPILVSGNKAKLMDMECISGKMGIGMKENGKIA